MFAGARNGGEALATEVRNLFAECEEPGCGRHLGFAAPMRILGKKVQEPADCHRIPLVRRPGALLFGSILACFRQQAGVGSGDDHRLCGAQRLCEPDRGSAGIHADLLAAQSGQGGSQRLASRHRDGVA